MGAVSLVRHSESDVEIGQTADGYVGPIVHQIHRGSNDPRREVCLASMPRFAENTLPHASGLFEW